MLGLNIELHRIYFYFIFLPADVMVCFGAKTIFANDVGSAVETGLTNYGDHLSGWSILYNKLFRVGTASLRVGFDFAFCDKLHK